MGYEADVAAVAVAETWTKGEKQPAKCNDVPFAILFFINIVIITAVAIRLGSPDVYLAKEGADDFSWVATLIQAVVLLSAISAALSALLFFILISFANVLIKISLVFSVVMSGVAALVMVSLGQLIGAALCVLAFAINICWAYCVWSRIPFATANLVTAMKAVQGNCGVVLVGYASVVMASVWSLIWVVAMIGVQTKTQTEDETGQEMAYPVYALMLLSYFFTHQVLQNTVHVTVAGVVGTWWFNPEESGCCSNAVFGAVYRSCTSAFGSICMGSLLVAIIQTLRQLARQARENEECSALYCVLECILSCLEDLIEYFNKWAYIYVGLYGYSYIEAGKNVFRLFQSRGWETIIADDLVGATLGMLSFVGGLVTAAIAYFLYADEPPLENGMQIGLLAALIGLLVGLVVISIVMSVIASAVNTVIVCFADAPAEFQSNHPELSNKMRAAWRSAYPDNFS